MTKYNYVYIPSDHILDEGTVLESLEYFSGRGELEELQTQLRNTKYVLSNLVAFLIENKTIKSSDIHKILGQF